MATIPDNSKVKIVECPRDAMQGILDFIPTSEKVSYINALLKVGFHTLDCGSFVSPKIIPQMRDTEEVLESIDLSNTNTLLSVIIANDRGADEAVKFKQVHCLGYPFSISETFQKRNTNKTILESLDTVKYILDLCLDHDKQMVVYVSMGFGNPYGDDWNSGIVTDWIGKLADLGVKQFSLSDTVGVSTGKSIEAVFNGLKHYTHTLDIGAHFHTTQDAWESKIKTAYNNGCKKFDGAIRGFGGCPMAKDDLVGNMPTECLVDFFGNEKLQLNVEEFQKSVHLTDQLFKNYL
jgi:hydroxymethylglutaryl-CoA lyase